MQILDISQKDYDQKRPIYEEIRVDTVFRKINKHSVGFHIWKVEHDHIEALNKDQQGIFYDENAYLLYAAAVKGTFTDQTTITREIKTPVTIERFIHVWLGENSTPEKSKNAALKIIELDIHLNHTATQYRETQGNEGIRFLSYFKENGYKILSGINTKSTPDYPRLFQIQGKTCPICIQKKTLVWQHFNSGNVMILQSNTMVFVWVGRSSSSLERVNSLKIATKFRETLNVAEIVVVDDGYEQSMSEKRKIEWNKYLNLNNRLVHPLVVPTSSQHSPLKLYYCSVVNGLFRVELVKSDGLEQTDLYDKTASYIIDGAKKGVWIWIGRNKSKQEKAEAMRNARGYIIKKAYLSTIPVIRVLDGHEPTDFITLFPHWIENDFGSNGTKHVLEKFDALTLTQRPKLAAQTQLIDDGSGDLKVYRIDYEDITDIPKRYGTVFYSGNCYIIHYQLLISGSSAVPGDSIQNLLYLWVGKQCSQSDKTTGELFLAEMFEHFKTSVAQIRVAEGLEPPHFLQLFKGKLIIFNGKSSSADPTGTGKKYPNSFILKVMGNSSYTAKAVQVSNKTIYTPKDCYILKVDSEIWIWCGQFSTGDTREVGKLIASIVGEPNLIMEGNETEEFYASVGDKCVNQLKKTQIIGTIEEVSLDSTWEKARVGLYLTTLVQGTITLEPILAFDQKDLSPENIYLLDAGNIIYVWLGNLSELEQRQAAWVIAMHHLSIHAIPRDNHLPVAVIKQGFEPITFIGFFDKWDLKYFENYVTFDKLRMTMDVSGTAPIPPPRSSVNDDKIGANEFDKHQKYPLEMLRGDPVQLPTYINPSRKEIHLTHDDFVSVFKMEFPEFEVLPKWKQVELKKHYKLF